MFITFGCSNDNNLNNSNTNKEENYLDYEKTYEFININIEDLYFVGEESDITISIYPERKIDNISYKSNNEEILIIDNNGHLKALKEGNVLITITIDNKEEKRIVKVEEDELFTALNNDEQTSSENVEGTTSQEWYEMYLRSLAREEEAKEHGFSSYKEYREYLSEIKAQERQASINEKFEETCRIAESLGLTWQDYICLQEYKITFDELNENAKITGYSFDFIETDVTSYGRMTQYKSIDYKVFYRFRIGTQIVNSKLGSFNTNQEYLYKTTFSDGTYLYSEYYFDVIVLNNYGYELDPIVWGKIEELLPEIEYYSKVYDYLIEVLPEEVLSEDKKLLYEKYGLEYVIYYLSSEFLFKKAINKRLGYSINGERKNKLTDEEIEIIDRYYKEYEENNNRN